MILETTQIKTLRGQRREGMAMGLIIGAAATFVLLSGIFGVQVSHARRDCETLVSYTGRNVMTIARGG